MSKLPLGASLCVLVSLGVTVLSRFSDTPVLADRFLDFGAKSTVAMLESGEWWRLLSASFLHAGPLHWLLNAALILGFGGAVETLYKRSDALLVYVTAALSTTIASTLASDGLALGASGIALGCLTCTTTFALRYYQQMQPRERFLLLAATLPTAATYLAGGFLVPGVDNAGHIAGAVSGVIAGLALDPKRGGGYSLAWLPIGVIAGVCAVSVIAPWSVVEWKQLRPADDVRIDVPSTFFETGTQSFENTLGTSILVEVTDMSAEAYMQTTLRRFAEAEDIHNLIAEPLREESIGGRAAHVLPLSFDGPRGEMVGWHVWVTTAHSALHAVWTARKKRSAQNEALFRTWLQHFSFSS